MQNQKINPNFYFATQNLLLIIRISIANVKFAFGQDVEDKSNFCN